ncbi:hypothetical protein, partial [uncultured Lactobacillus sp.]|uniref:hypothetical protein n=1 Tax=uncultured Lactobacillus sp. TaxID=153152 RepID=UPI002729B40F
MDGLLRVRKRCHGGWMLTNVPVYGDVVFLPEDGSPEGNVLCLTLRDSIVAQGKRESITSYLTDVFGHRFRRPVEIRVSYEKPKESRLKYNEIRLEQEVDEILRQNAAVQEERTLKEPRQAEENEAVPGNKASGRKTGDPDL